MKWIFRWTKMLLRASSTTIEFRFITKEFEKKNHRNWFDKNGNTTIMPIEQRKLDFGIKKHNKFWSIKKCKRANREKVFFWHPTVATKKWLSFGKLEVEWLKYHFCLKCWPQYAQNCSLETQKPTHTHTFCVLCFQLCIWFYAFSLGKMVGKTNTHRNRDEKKTTNR